MAQMLVAWCVLNVGKREEISRQASSFDLRNHITPCLRGLPVTVWGQQIIVLLREQQGGTSDIIHQSRRVGTFSAVLQELQGNCVTGQNIHTVPVNIKLVAYMLSSLTCSVEDRQLQKQAALA